MENFIEHFGINPVLIVAQIVNFLVILYILKRFLYKPIFAEFKKREQLIKDNLARAEETQKVLEKTQKQEKEILKKAQQTANQILKDSRDQAAALVEKTEVTAKKRTEQMIQEARLQIAQETKEAEAKLSKQVSKLSIEILEKSLKNVFGEREQEVVVQRAMKVLEKN